MLKVVKGDLIGMSRQGEFEVIAHGCNCFNTMGAGIAALVKKFFPEAYEADKKSLKGDKGKLGKCTAAKIDLSKGNVSIQKDLIVVNCYSQYYYDSRNGAPIDYNAMRSALELTVNKFGVSNRIGVPLIGYGLAGGDLTKVLEVFYDVLKDYDATIVVYEKEKNADKLVDVIKGYIELRKIIEKEGF